MKKRERKKAAHTNGNKTERIAEKKIKSFTHRFWIGLIFNFVLALWLSRTTFSRDEFKSNKRSRILINNNYIHSTLTPNNIIKYTKVKQMYRTVWIRFSHLHLPLSHSFSHVKNDERARRDCKLWQFLDQCYFYSTAPFLLRSCCFSWRVCHRIRIYIFWTFFILALFCSVWF